jgi:hypothetical protein
VLGFVRAIDSDADVIGLVFGEDRQLDADLGQVQAGDFFVELFRQDGDADFAAVAGLPEFDLSQRLVGEAVAHDEARVTGGAAEVHEATFSEHVDAVAGREGVLVHLSLDVEALDVGAGIELIDLDFVVEVTDVADDGLVLHQLHVLQGDDVFVASGGDVDVAGAEGVLDWHHAETFHGGLEGADGVDLGDDHLSAHAAKGSSAAFANIAVTADHADFARDHHIGGTLDAVEQGFAAAVEVVEFGLGDAVVDVDGREEQLARTSHFIEAVDAGGGLFGDTFEVLNDGVENAGLLDRDVFEQVFDDLDFVVVGRGVDPVVAVFHFVAFVDEQGHVATVIDDELRSFVAGEDDGLPGAPPVFFQGLTFPSKDRGAGGCDRGCGMVLSGEDIARSPAHIGTEFLEGLDEHAGLNGHVQRAGDADASERLLRAVFLAGRHKAGHFVLSNVEFLAAEVGQGDVFYFVISHEVCSCLG